MSSIATLALAAMIAGATSDADDASYIRLEAGDVVFVPESVW